MTDIIQQQKSPLNFIHAIIKADLEADKHNKIVTRFPPEPNGYLHIGHAKSICLNFGIASYYSGQCNLRFDDTNPITENIEYVENIKEDARWLGVDWGKNIFFASDYFEQLYGFAVRLIELGKAYVDDQTVEQIRENRGSLTASGKNSPWRDRSIKDNLDLFQRMRKGDFKDGSHVLRAKIDMTSANIIMRDPTLYRIRKMHHHRTGNAWCIYPMYDFAHCLSDTIEGITHSICTLEFENNRELYDWILDTLGFDQRPRQYEFARLNLTHTVLSKRKLRQLVEEGLVSGWDDPRMPTISGMRRRGYPPEAIRDFCERIGVARSNNKVDLALLEHCVREELNSHATRRMAVLKPLKLIIENYPENHVEEFELLNNPGDERAGTRKTPFSKVLWIEHNDFRKEPPPKYFRLAPGKEVRLRGAYYITCMDFDIDSSGEVSVVRCSFDPATRGGWSKDGRKVKGTLHWVSAAHAVEAEVRLYSSLFNIENPGAEKDVMPHINPLSLEILAGCKLEPELAHSKPGERFQFERLGYFTADVLKCKPGVLVFNRTATLHDAWAKIEKIANVL